MLAQMGSDPNFGSGAGPSGVDDSDSDDGDAGPPPLEEVPPAKTT
jgi:hypothetical protein